MPEECDGTPPPRWHASASGGGFDTTIKFTGNDSDVEREVDLREATVFATLSWQRTPHYSLQLTLGGILDGSATPAGAGKGDVGGGGAVSLGWSWLALYEQEKRPFLQVAASLGVSSAGVVSDDGMRHQLTAGDLRVGVLVGKTFFERVTIFAAARGFAGPVFWHLGGEGVMGGDTHHYALGLGTVLRLPGRIDVFAEAMALGERSVSLGAGLAF